VPYFGEYWNSGICETEEQVPTPVGTLCFECDEPIEEGQRGNFYFANSQVHQSMDERYLVWVLTSLVNVPMGNQSGSIAMNPVHRECGLRAVQGGIGHWEDHAKWCEGLGDPDGGRTRRQSSLEVWDHIVRLSNFRQN
jgi:hypothetical protein